jgi:IS5 family transposase
MLKPKSSQLSFYGNHIYDQIIPDDHFLKLLEKVVDFSFVNDFCRDAYNPDAGRPAYEPEMMFKILFLQFLYDISDRRIEEEVNFNLALKWFVGLAINESSPDATSLTRFRGRLGVKRFTGIFNQIVSLARDKGLISDRLSIVDSTHVKAKVDTFRMHTNPDNVKDTEARYGYKTQNKPFFGYKSHTGIDADSEIITKVETTSGNVHDGQVFHKVVDEKAQMVTADKAYDSKKNHRLLKRKKKTSAIIVKKNRKSKRLKKQQMKVEVQAAQQERPKIERKFAELKRFHGLAVARYWGLAKMSIQNLMAAICCNLKRMVKLILLRREGKLFIPLRTTEGIPMPI